jgi:hypothetical protein
MTTLPPILIVTDRGHFVAYRLHPGESPEVLQRADFSEGTDKLSEMVTDQAGRFGSGGMDSSRHSAAERPKLVLELESRCVRQIAAHITEVLTEHAGTWGLAAPGDIMPGILDQLSLALRKRLHLNLSKDLVKVPVGEIAGYFRKARENA